MVGCGTEQSVTNVPSNNKSQSAATATVISAINPTTTLPVTPSVISSTTISTDWRYRWLRGTPCRPPCWEGIIPGQTTATEAIKLLQNNSFISNVRGINITPPSKDFGNIFWDWKDQNKGSGDLVYNPEAPIKIINFIALDYNVSFKLTEVMQVYGEPSHVQATATINPDFSYSYDIKVVYLSQGFALRTSVTSKNASNKPTLNETTTLERLDFFIKGIDGFAESYKRPPLKTYLVPWQGFKDFDFYLQKSKE